MKRPDYRTLQALDAVIRERGFERAAQKLCIPSPPSHSVLGSWKICSVNRCWCAPCRHAPPSRGKSCWPCYARVELLEEEWLGDEQTGSTPLLLSLAVNADSLATWLPPALANVLSDSLFVLTCRWKMKPAPRSACAVGSGGRSEYPAAGAPSCLVDQLGALDYLFVASKSLRNAISRTA